MFLLSELISKEGHGGYMLGRRRLGMRIEVLRSRRGAERSDPYSDICALLR